MPMTKPDTEAAAPSISVVGTQLMVSRILVQDQLEASQSFQHSGSWGCAVLRGQRKSEGGRSHYHQEGQICCGACQIHMNDSLDGCRKTVKTVPGQACEASWRSSRGNIVACAHVQGLWICAEDEHEHTELQILSLKVWISVSIVVDCKIQARVLKSHACQILILLTPTSWVDILNQAATQRSDLNYAHGSSVHNFMTFLRTHIWQQIVLTLHEI